MAAERAVDAAAVVVAKVAGKAGVVERAEVATGEVVEGVGAIRAAAAKALVG